MPPSIDPFGVSNVVITVPSMKPPVLCIPTALPKGPLFLIRNMLLGPLVMLSLLTN